MKKPTGKSTETMAPILTAALRGREVTDRQGRDLVVDRIEGNCYWAKCYEPATGKMRGIVINTLRDR
jgi:hypothetical protein